MGCACMSQTIFFLKPYQPKHTFTVNSVPAGLNFRIKGSTTIDTIYLTVKEKVDQLWLLIIRELLRTFTC